ncbi:hypothetical protein CsSME_00046163 [Camellia sinensis var. sinensis]
MWPDKRVIGLIKHMGSQVNPKQKRVLCMNKVDLVEKKKDLLKKASDSLIYLFLFSWYFMISGLKGSGVKDITQYLMEQAVKRPWDEDPLAMSEEVMKSISLEVVRERLLDHEIPYGIQHHLVDWKELRDGSLGIEQHFITHKMSQRKILVGKNGSKIGGTNISICYKAWILQKYFRCPCPKFDLRSSFNLRAASRTNDRTSRTYLPSTCNTGTAPRISTMVGMAWVRFEYEMGTFWVLLGYWTGG